MSQAGTFWEGDSDLFYVVERATQNTWRVLNLMVGTVDHLWFQDGRMRKIDTFEWLRRVDA